MCNPRYAQHSRRVVNYVHHAPVTDADAPLTFVSLELFATHRPGSVAQAFEFSDNAGQDASGNASSSFRAAGFTWTA
jgi:hypothetical protein